VNGTRARLDVEGSERRGSHRNKLGKTGPNCCLHCNEVGRGAFYERRTGKQVLLIRTRAGRDGDEGTKMTTHVQISLLLREGARAESDVGSPGSKRRTLTVSADES
jgi:hypothetical protein